MFSHWISQRWIENEIPWCSIQAPGDVAAGCCPEDRWGKTDQCGWLLAWRVIATAFAKDRSIRKTNAIGKDEMAGGITYNGYVACDLRDCNRRALFRDEYGGDTARPPGEGKQIATGTITNIKIPKAVMRKCWCRTSQVSIRRYLRLTTSSKSPILKPRNLNLYL